MSDAAFDFNMQAIRMGMNLGKGAQGADPIANEKDMLEYMFDSIGSGISGTGSMLTGVPNKMDIWSTGLFKQFELPEGLNEKMILNWQTTFSSPGGFLYRMFASLIKNRDITPMTDVPGEGMALAGEAGGASGDAGGGGATGDGGNYGEAALADFGGAPMVGGGAEIEPMTVDYGGRRYEAASMSEEALGNITPSSGTDAGSISKDGIEIG